MMANQLRNRNNLATWESINHQPKFEKSLDLSLGARDKFCC